MFDDTTSEAPTIEVRIFRDGVEIVREFCESEEEVDLVVARWNDEANIVCMIDDLAVHHVGGEILEPDEAAGSDEGG